VHLTLKMTSGGKNFTDFPDNRLANLVRKSKKITPNHESCGDQVVLVPRLPMFFGGEDASHRYHTAVAPMQIGYSSCYTRCHDNLQVRGRVLVAGILTTTTVTGHRRLSCHNLMLEATVNHQEPT